MPKFDEYEYDVCTNCLVVAVNGDYSGVSKDDPYPLRLVPRDHHLCTRSCEHDDNECDGGCYELGFCSRGCEGCGEPLAGDRFAMVALVEITA